jgi:hypothetical protein
MMRKSRQTLLATICSCGDEGYFARGQNAVFAWLAEHALVRSHAVQWGGYVITDAGRAELLRLGLCDRCGSRGAYSVPHGNLGGRQWVRCDHGARGGGARLAVDARMHLLRCALCADPIPIDPERPPYAGAVTVCRCGGVSFFDAANCLLRKPSAHEAADLRQDPRVLAALGAVSPWLKR